MMTLFLFLMFLAQKPTTTIWTVGGCTAYLSASSQLAFTTCSGAFDAFDPRTLETQGTNGFGRAWSYGDTMVIWQKSSATDLLHYQVATGGAVVADGSVPVTW